MLLCAFATSWHYTVGIDASFVGMTNSLCAFVSSWHYAGLSSVLLGHQELLHVALCLCDFVALHRGNRCFLRRHDNQPLCLCVFVALCGAFICSAETSGTPSCCFVPLCLRGITRGFHLFC